MPLPSSFTNSSNYFNSSIDAICPSQHSSLVALNLTLTDMATKESITQPINTTACTQTTLPICVDNVYTVPYSIPTCRFSQTVPGIQALHEYTLTVTALLSDGSVRSNMQCLFTNSLNCTPQLFVPTRTILPADVRSLYGVPVTTPIPSSGVTQAIAALIATQNYNTSDLALFFSTSNEALNSSLITYLSRPYFSSNGTHAIQGIVNKINNGYDQPPANISVGDVINDPNTPTPESSLDIQWFTSMGLV